MNLIYILIAIFVFGLLILMHEGGHYVFARLFGVTVNEFSIGMGPKLFQRVSKKTGIAYSLRALPIGGYVSMVGEDEDTDDPNALNRKPYWQRFIILAAGASVNILAGILVMSILVASADRLPSTVIYQFMDGSTSNVGATEDGGLRENDRILAVDGVTIHIANELVYEVMHRATVPVDVTVLRDGSKIVVKDVSFPLMSEQGVTFGSTDFYVYSEAKTVLSVLKHAFFRSVSTVKMIWESLIDLISGRYGVEAVSGPVGVTKVVSEAAASGLSDFMNLVVVISMNLGIMNLLPFPALDGGRILFLLIEAVFRRPIPRSVEGAINLVGFAALMLLMIVITVKDVVDLIP